MFNILSFSFNQIDIVCFSAIYFLFATFFGKKLFRIFQTKHIEYVYFLICLSAILMCIYFLHSSDMILTVTNNIMLLTVLMIFSVLMLKTINNEESGILLDSDRDDMYLPKPRIDIDSYCKFATQNEYEDVYKPNITTENQCSAGKNEKSGVQLDNLKEQLSFLQQQINEIKDTINELKNSAINNLQTIQQGNSMDDRIIIIADKLHEMETQFTDKQQEIENIKAQLLQQDKQNQNQIIQTEKITNSIIAKIQEPITQQIDDLKSNVDYLKNALQKTVDRIAKVFSLLKVVMKNYNNSNYAQ